MEKPWDNDQLQIIIRNGLEKQKLLQYKNLTLDDIDLFIPHQANKRINDAVATRLGINSNRAYVNIDRVGNTSAASIPIALDECVRNDGIKRDDHVLFAAFGAGLTWAANVLRWY